LAVLSTTTIRASSGGPWPREAAHPAASKIRNPKSEIRDKKAEEDRVRPTDKGTRLLKLGPVLFVLLLVAGDGASAGNGFAFFEPQTPPRVFQVIARRGEAGQAPENTRAALQRCIDDLLEWAEVDVRLTRDRQHILSHSSSISDATGRSFVVSESTLEDLQRMDVGSVFAPGFAGEHPLSLKDCFTLCKGKLNLYLDCKVADPEQLAREILSARMERQVVVYGGLEFLQRVRAASGGRVATMAKWRPAFGCPAWAVTNRLAAVEIDSPHLTAAVRRKFERAGVRVQVKLLDEQPAERSVDGNAIPASWSRALEAGATWAQTDRPEELLAHALWRRVSRRPVQISFHRGGALYAPENTLPAFSKAARMGADYVEFDVRATRDGEFFLLHDSRLDRTTDGTGPIADADAEAVRTLSAGARFGTSYAGVRVPSLDEFLAAVRKPGLYLDAKAISPAALATALQKHRAVERTVVYQSPEYLGRLRAINPAIRRLAPLRTADELPRLIESLHPHAVDAEWSILSKGLISRCHEAGIRVFSDALGDHERVRDYLQAMDWGIDVIQTDHPLRVMRAIELRLAAGATAGKPRNVSERMPIALGGLARCEIVTQPGATAAERYAAEELAAALGQITGATFDVREEPGASPGPPPAGAAKPAIVVGFGAAAAQWFPEAARLALVPL
jgi:glycerophosphoryl diester phosphodiesterase